MKKTDEHKQMVSSLCEYGTFINNLDDCQWCGEWCYKNTNSPKELNHEQQVMEDLIQSVEKAEENYKNAVLKTFKLFGGIN